MPTRLSRWVSSPPAIWAALIYLVAALALFGGPLFEGGNACVCRGADATIPLWGFEWFPYAIAHGLNPFWTHVIYVPKGFNVAIATVMPGAALLLAPITFTAGPLAAYNVAVIASPALAAFFAFLLCRRLTGGRFWPALLGGWLFGFSDYVLGQMIEHLHMTVVFLVPAIVHIVLRAQAGELSRRRFIALMTLALVLQISFATELFASLTVFGAVAFGVAYLTVDQRTREQLRPLLGQIVCAYALAALITSPFLYYAVQPGGLPIVPSRSENFSAALMSFIVPPRLMEVGGSTFVHTTGAFSAGIVEGGTYLGLPLLAIVALAARGAWRRPGGRALLITGLITVVCSMGSYLQLVHHTHVPLPWWPASHSPLTGLMIPARFAMFTALAVAVLAAWWLARTRRQPLAWGLALLSVAFLWPAVQRGYWKYHKPLPALFTSSRYRNVIGSHDVALIVPVGPKGYSMLWQAETGLRFEMASGYLPPPESPNPYKHDRIYPTLADGTLVPHVERAAEKFLAASHVTVAVVDLAVAPARPWLRILERLGWRPQRVGGAIVLRPAGSAQAAAWRDRSPTPRRTQA